MFIHGGICSFKSFHKVMDKYKGRKKFIVHNNLLVGEKVIIAVTQGGQKYIVLDRMG